MKHWQVLKLLMVAESWSEITQDKFVKNEEWFYVQKGEILPQ
jgi:hypothetical protein